MAPISTERTSSRPAVATLIEHGEREHHDQPEQDLGHALDGIEHALALRGSLGAHAATSGSR